MTASAGFSGYCPMAGLMPADLGHLMPMYLWLDTDGAIRDTGPTLAKILGPDPVRGDRFSRHFRLHRARARRSDIEDDPGLALTGGQRVSLTLVAHPEITLRGTAVSIGCGDRDGRLIDLTFGIHIFDIVRDFGLTEADFAASDLAMELLYLQEAKSTVLTELRALTQRLEEARLSAMTQAMTDALTGLSNRRAFEIALDTATRAQIAGGSPFAVVSLDLDFFKEVNDAMGHAAGDEVLVNAARALREETRRGDIVARVGGDEFVLLLRGPLPQAQLMGLAERIIQRLEEPMRIDGQECRISASIGIACSARRDPERVGEVLADADEALYVSKRAGRGRCTMAGGEQATC